MDRRTLLAGLIASPFFAWFGFKSKSVEASPIVVFHGHLTFPYENIEDGDRGTLISYDFCYRESKQIKNPPHCRFVEFPNTMNLELTYNKDGCETIWHWICHNPKLDGYPFNIKKFITNPIMDDDGILHSHSNIRAGNICYRMYGENKFMLSSIAFCGINYERNLLKQRPPPLSCS